MMEKQLFKATERKLYDYFQVEKKISCLNLKIKILERHLETIQRNISQTNITIPAESRSTNYEETVQTSKNTSSYAERTAIRIIEDMEDEMAYKLEEISIIEKIIRDIEADNAIIEYNLNFLSDDDRRFLELKYKDGNKDWQIGVTMGIDQSTATRIRRRLVSDIARWDNLLNLKNVH